MVVDRIFKSVDHARIVVLQCHIVAADEMIHRAWRISIRTAIRGLIKQVWFIRGFQAGYRGKGREACRWLKTCLLLFYFFYYHRPPAINARRPQRWIIVTNYYIVYTYTLFNIIIYIIHHVIRLPTYLPDNWFVIKRNWGLGITFGLMFPWFPTYEHLRQLHNDHEDRDVFRR